MKLVNIIHFWAHAFWIIFAIGEHFSKVCSGPGAICFRLYLLCIHVSAIYCLDGLEFVCGGVKVLKIDTIICLSTLPEVIKDVGCHGVAEFGL